MSDEDLGFVHRFDRGASALTVLALHGTGGDEHDLVPLVQGLAPGASVLSPRGKILENGAPRFFRRLAEGVFDLEDVRYRADELATFIERACARYELDAGRLVALGFSNGANMAAVTMLLQPRVIAGAVLFRAMLVVEPDTPPDLTGRNVLLSAGRLDPIVPASHAEQLAALFERCGATTELKWQQAAHGLVPADFIAAREWLARQS